MFFKNKVVWITGASSGIGEALTYEFAHQGAKLIISSNQQQELEKVKLQCEKLGVDCFIQFLDITEIDKMQTITDGLVSKFGQIDVLVNNAGISQRSMVIDTSIDIDRKIM